MPPTVFLTKGNSFSHSAGSHKCKLKVSTGLASENLLWSLPHLLVIVRFSVAWLLAAAVPLPSQDVLVCTALCLDPFTLSPCPLPLFSPFLPSSAPGITSAAVYMENKHGHWTLFVAQAGFKSSRRLLHPPECWEYRHIPPCLTSFLLFFTDNSHGG